MEKRIVKFLSNTSGIDTSFFPMDIYYLSERIGEVNTEEPIETITVKKINYIGYEKYRSASRISLCFSPLKVIKNG